MKPIKFDLPMNGMKISTLEQLQDNLTPQILEHFRSGKLVKWLRSRSLDEQAVAVESLLAADIQDEVQLFKKVCEVFEVEVDDDIAADMIEDYKTSSSENTTEAEPEQQSTSDNATEEEQKTESKQDESTKEAEQIKLFEEGDEKQRIELASRPDLLEKLQAQLIVVGTAAVHEALAKNRAITVTQQTALFDLGNYDVYLALLQNHWIDGALRKQILSFSKNDLSRMESSLEYTEERVKNLESKYSKAQEQYNREMDCLTPKTAFKAVFSLVRSQFTDDLTPIELPDSTEKDYIQGQLSDAEREKYNLDNKIHKLKKILTSQAR